MAFQNEANAQMRLKTELERDSILIGEQVWLKFTAYRSQDDEIEWPAFLKTIKTADDKELEIVKQSELEITEEDGNQIREQQSFLITVFDTGFYVIPPFSFGYKKSGDSIFVDKESEAVLLSVYAPDLGAQPEPKALKDPLKMPFVLAEIKNELFIAGIILLLLIGAYLWWRNRPKPEPKEEEPEPEPETPPYPYAMQRLKALEQRKLWQNGEIKSYYSELSEILREYLERRYEFPALESTTDEIADRLYRKELDRELKIKVKEFLVLSDLVKFAKSVPQEDEHRQSFKLVLEFLRATKPQERKPSKEEGDNA